MAAAIAFQDLNSVECLNSHQKIAPKDLAGRVVLYFVFRETDVLSMAYLNKMKEWAEHYKKHFLLVGIYSPLFPKESEPEYLQHLIHQYDIQFPFFLDHQGLIKKIYSIKVEPGFVLFDTLGRRRNIGSGSIDLKVLHESIVSLINESIKTGAKSPLNSIQLQRAPEVSGFLKYPEFICYDNERELLFISDTGHSRILAIDINGKLEFTIGSGQRGDEDGDFKNCKFHSPKGLCIVDDVLYVADSGSNRVKSVDLKSSKVKNIVGTGVLGFFQSSSHKGTRISLSYPTDVKLIKEDNKSFLLICNSASRQILKFDIEKEKVDLYLGSGKERYDDDSFRHANLLQSTSLMTDIPGFVFMNDSLYGSLRLAHADKLKTIAGSDEGIQGDSVGDAINSRFRNPQGLAWDFSDFLYFTDTSNCKVKYFSLSKKQVFELPLPETFNLKKPQGICCNSEFLFVVDCYQHQLLRKNLQTSQWEKIAIHFADKTEDSRESVGNLPILKNLKQEEKKSRSQMGSIDMNVSITLPEGYKLNPDSSSTLVVYEKHITHWYLVRKIKLNEESLMQELLLRNVGQTDHYVIDIRMKLSKLGSSFEYFESDYRLHIEQDQKVADRDVVWDVLVEK